jgi:DNA-binding transcriptional MerR regulator
MGEKLSRKQEQCIGALLVQPTLGDAAEATGIAESTLRRWLKQPTFQTAYRQARRDAVSQAIARLQQVTTTAVDTLEGVMKDSAAKEAAKVTAAKTVLELAIRTVELEDIDERLHALEEELAVQKKGRSDA